MSDDGRWWAAAAVAGVIGATAVAGSLLGSGPRVQPLPTTVRRWGSRSTRPMPFQEYLQECWWKAFQPWGGTHVTNISPFQGWIRTADWQGEDPIAYIDLLTRQVVVNFDQLAKLDALDALTGIFAHELGHHLRFPATLGFAAKLEVLQQDLLPNSPSLTNLFFDLQINEVVGRTMAADLQKVYRNSRLLSEGKKNGGFSPLFTFYLALYEELWRLPEGDLCGDAASAAIVARHPRWRAEARRFAQTFWSISNPVQQFRYCCDAFAPYLAEAQKQRGQGPGPHGDPGGCGGGGGSEGEGEGEGEGQGQGQGQGGKPGRGRGQPGQSKSKPGDGGGRSGRIEGPLANDVPMPSAEDVANAIDDMLKEKERKKAKAKAGKAKDQGEEEDPRGHGDPGGLVKTVARAMGMPGNQILPFQRRVMSQIYERLVDEHLFKIPPVPGPMPDPTIPIGTLPWDFGDDPSELDWGESMRRHGKYAPALGMFRRQKEIDPDVLVPGIAIPAMEIYLDTSGSMPDPVQHLNTMSLAAQILAAATIRNGGQVRGIIYSAGDPLISDWYRSEKNAREFLMSYVGGGTDFPFGVASRFADKDTPGATLRVVISDSDFLSNVGELGHSRGYGRSRGRAQEPWSLGQFERTIDRSQRFVAVLQLPPRIPLASTSLQPLLGHPKFQVVVVGDMSAFAKAATDLADALFPQHLGGRNRRRMKG